MLDCGFPREAHVYFHSNSFLFRKKNQLKGELESKRKAKGDEVIREMFAFGILLFNDFH